MPKFPTQERTLHNLGEHPVALKARDRFRQKLGAWMGRRNLSPEEVAQKAGCGRNTIPHILNGDNYPSFQLAAVLEEMMVKG